MLARENLHEGYFSEYSNCGNTEADFLMNEGPVDIAYMSVFYPYRGGIAQFNAALYRAFEELGHHQKAYTFTRQYPDMLFPGSSQFVTE